MDAAVKPSRQKSNDGVNRIRGRVSLWRDRFWPDVTTTTRRLLEC